MARDFLGIDFQPLKERLIEKSPLLRASLAIGRLDSVGQRQGHIKRPEHFVMPYVQRLDELGGAIPLPPDAGLFLGKEPCADLVGVVRRQQLALLAFETSEIVPSCPNLLGRHAPDGDHLGSHSRPDALTALLWQFHGCVVALNCRLNRRHPVMALRAGAFLATTTDEVFVEPAVATCLGVGQPFAALRTKQAAAQVVEVTPGLFAALALAVQHVLNSLERRLVNQRLMPTLVGLAVVADDTHVIRIAQHPVQPIDAEHFG